MARNRTYDQYCAVARGLDVVGDRWTLLIVRELLTGPKRYGELATGLPGIATNLLADRLRSLEAAAVIERAPGPGATRGRPYRLTAWGDRLEPVLLELARWASPLLGPPGPTDAYRLRWLVLTLRARFDPSAAGDLTRTYEFRIDDEVAHVAVGGGSARPSEGAAGHADVVVIADVGPFLRWGTGRTDADGAVAEGVEVRGRRGVPHPDPVAALEEISRIFGDA